MKLVKSVGPTTIGRFSSITDPYARRDGTRRHNYRGQRAGVAGFVGVDGEGVTLADRSHPYVLLGCGDEQIEDPGGLHWETILQFLYSLRKPKTSYVGFYLGYDFTQWIKTMPEDRARRLLTIEGKESRRSASPKMRGIFLPVDLPGWQIDMLAAKRFAFRRHECDCETMKCPHKPGEWMYICDAGPFFQTSFLNVIDPAKWTKPIASQAEYDKIVEGKAKRDTAVLDDDMRYYNRLENKVLARVMEDLNEGFRGIGVALSAQQWYGPGQAAQVWMADRAPSTKQIADTVPPWFLDAARCSYFGGWFEIMAHGIIPGVCHEYDINSAYPAVIRDLPCLLHGDYSQGRGTPRTGPRDLCLVRARVWAHSPDSHDSHRRYVGAMLHRDVRGRITRPLVTEGWFWWHELEAARRAGLITKVAGKRIYEWVKYTPCDCPTPLREVADLYQLRLEAGKASSKGKSAKLVYNSMYGKTAQSIGNPLYANPVYASLITAGCRVKITDAIGTHPGGLSNVVMVATDAVFFLDPHPLLPVSSALGQWDYQSRSRLTLFKPGVYWDDAARERIAAGKHAAFKARGVSAADFSQAIAEIDRQFSEWDGVPPPIADSMFDPEEVEALSRRPWPKVEFRARFAMVTALQALMRNDWGQAGIIDMGADGLGKPLEQRADPSDKRCNSWYDQSVPQRPIYRSEPHWLGGNATRPTIHDLEAPVYYASVPYAKRFGIEDPFSDESRQAFGVSPDEAQPLTSALRALTGKE